MKNTIKTVLTVLVVMGCLFVCLISFGVYLSEKSTLKYDISSIVEPVIKEAKAEYIGDSYAGEEREGCSYYNVKVTLENNSNFGLNEGYIHFIVENTGENNYSISKEKENRPFDVWEEGYYYPAGKTADYNMIVCVDNECKAFDVIYRNNRADREQKITVTL